MVLTNRFEGICGTFGEERKTYCQQQHWFNLPKKIEKIKTMTTLLSAYPPAHGTY
jgi:hypothetical protein